jgi:hypothetical protein
MTVQQWLEFSKLFVAAKYAHPYREHIDIVITDGIGSLPAVYIPDTHTIVMDIKKLEQEAKYNALPMVDMAQILLAHELGHAVDPFIKDLCKASCLREIIGYEDRAWLFGYNFIDVDLVKMYDAWNKVNVNAYKVYGRR